MTATSYTPVGNIAYAYIEAGEGPLVLFGHGTFGGKELFLPQIEELSSEFRCVAIDWPGHGQSGYDPAGWGVDQLVDDVPALIDALGCTSAFLAGVSQGGAVFMRVALKYPDRVDGLITMCAGPGAPPPEALARLGAFAVTLSDEQDERVRRRAAEEFVSTMFHAPGFTERNPDAAAHEIGVILGHPREAIALAPQVPASYSSIVHRLPDIRCPVLVVWGEDDLRPGVGVEIANAIPNAQLVTIQDAGHHVNVDAPAETSTAIKRFLHSVAQ